MIVVKNISDADLKNERQCNSCKKLATTEIKWGLHENSLFSLAVCEKCRLEIVMKMMK